MQTDIVCVTLKKINHWILKVLGTTIVRPARLDFLTDRSSFRNFADYWVKSRFKKCFLSRYNLLLALCTFTGYLVKKKKRSKQSFKLTGYCWTRAFSTGIYGFMQMSRILNTLMIGIKGRSSFVMKRRKFKYLHCLWLIIPFQHISLIFWIS